jgi:hypothetical protein
MGFTGGKKFNHSEWLFSQAIKRVFIFTVIEVVRLHIDKRLKSEISVIGNLT